MSKRPPSSPIDILLVEDNPGDRRLTIEGLKESLIQNRVHVTEDGIEAMDFLRQDGKYADAPRPDLILLDLNLPKMDGREVLKKIKEDTQLRHIPVVVLTTSSAGEDIKASYESHVNCFITKPDDYEHFVDVVQSIEDFWLNTVQLPS